MAYGWKNIIQEVKFLFKKQKQWNYIFLYFFMLYFDFISIFTYAAYDYYLLGQFQLSR